MAGKKGGKDKKEKKEKKEKKPKAKGRKGKKEKKEKAKADAYSAVAMENAYYICHSVGDFLHYRGFKWAGAGKKKGKKK
ncbi:small lysine-rich protein 1-like [Amphibalanus amphitrite]|uniref:small lysine-rich protein 1-like n=1 Tax=Amphibalanus amphitrite TaxID=1232801 RepID=UPI001C9103DF|nr:small lysine-rich protein 1-like [Amphibalanus amphitrite]